jgi:hypothetical protein
MDFTANQLHFQGVPSSDDDEVAMEASLSKIKVAARPFQVLTVETVDRLLIPGLATLTKPIQNTKITYQGKSLAVEMETVVATMLDSTKNDQVTKNACSDASQAGGGFGSSIPVPFPVSVSLKKASIVKATDGSLLQLTSLSIYLNPDRYSQGTQLAIELDEFKNELLQLTKANVFALLPFHLPDEIHSLTVGAESAKVTAGQSTHEWKKKFEPKPKLRSKTNIINLPNASVEPIKLVISWKGTGVSLKDTAITTPPFCGHDKTTSKDLILYFTQTCMMRVPGFISNAEVLGVNLVEFATAMGLHGLAGGAGLAAVVAVDSVKGAVNAGKKSRAGDEGLGYRPGDLIRGIVHASVETANSAAIKHGKEKGNVLDFASGVSSATGSYVGTNKSRLGAASAGGAGAIVGTVFGGPLGGLAGGFLASKFTGSTIDRVTGKEKQKDTKI